MVSVLHGEWNLVAWCRKPFFPSSSKCETSVIGNRALISFNNIHEFWPASGWYMTKFWSITVPTIIDVWYSDKWWTKAHCSYVSTFLCNNEYSKATNPWHPLSRPSYNCVDIVSYNAVGLRWEKTWALSLQEKKQKRFALVIAIFHDKWMETMASEMPFHSPTRNI